MKQTQTKLMGFRSLILLALTLVFVDIGAGSALAQSADAEVKKSEPTSELTTEANSDKANPLQVLVIEAGRAQAAGEFRQAAKLWREVLDQDIPPEIRSKAHFNAGLCYSQVQDFEPSIFHFKKGLAVATPESAAEVPQALFYLGYGQLELGRALQTKLDKSLTGEEAKQQKQRAMQLLTTSSQTLGKLQRRSPDFAGVDQAAFFQAKAFDMLGRLDEASKAYQAVLSYDEPTFAVDAQFGLADTLEKLGQPDEALRQYRSLIAQADSFTPAQRPMLVESQFRAAEVLMKLGDARITAGDDQEAANDFANAFELYESVVNQNDNQQLVPLAMYGAAWSKLNAADGVKQAAAAKEADVWFTRLIEGYPEHNLFADAMTGRGSARRLAGQLADAAKDLVDVTAGPDGNAAREDARLELGLAHVKQASWDDAIEVFESLIKDFSDSPVVDRYRYELAWALKSATPAQSDAALEQFATIVEAMPNSPLAAEAHFHLGSADYDAGKFESAVKHFAVVLNSDLPDGVLERSGYQSAWAEYRSENYDGAAEQFAKQLKMFPDGTLATDAKVMFAESQFQQDKHSDALEAYLVAKPAIDADGNVDPKLQMLTALHGARSANESQQYDEAIQFATPVTTANDIPEAYQADAWLEIGIALAAKGDEAAAIEAWQNAVVSMSVTGARARSLLGEALAGQQKYQDGLNQFKLVYFGFGGVDADDDIRPWQAYALYEAARLNQSLARDAVGPVLKQRIDEAIGQYDRLIEFYADSDMAAEAKRQLAKLKQF